MRSLFMGAIALVCIATSANAWNVEEMNRAIDSVNFLVNDGCSGTLLDAKEGLILTAEHCVSTQYETIKREKIGDDGVITEEKIRRLKDGSVSQLMFHGSESVQTVVYKVRLLSTSKDHDLALMKIIAPIPHAQSARIACSEPVRGEPVYIVGNPMGDLYSSVTAGIVSSTQRDYRLINFPAPKDKAPLMQISGGVVGGNSGGSVWNVKGELVGVPVLASRINEVLGFAAPLASIKEFLKDRPALFEHCGN
jgi:S1-C subfamily serine protease